MKCCGMRAVMTGEAGRPGRRGLQDKGSRDPASTPRRRRGGGRSAGEPGLDQVADLAHVRPTLHLGPQRIHDLAHVLHARGAGALRRFPPAGRGSRPRSTGPAGRRRESRASSSSLVSRSVLPALANWVAASRRCLISFSTICRTSAIGHLAAVIDLPLLDGGHQHADRAKAKLFAAAHGGLHVFVDPGLERHAHAGPDVHRVSTDGAGDCSRGTCA